MFALLMVPTSISIAGHLREAAEVIPMSPEHSMCCGSTSMEEKHPKGLEFSYRAKLRFGVWVIKPRKLKISILIWIVYDCLHKSEY